MTGNIAIICLSHYWGGMELDALKLANAFEERGHPLIFICKNASKLYFEADSRCLKNIRPISFKRHLDINLIISLYKIMKKENICNIIFFGTSEIKSIFFAKFFSNHNINVVVRYGTTMSSSKRDLLHKLFYSCVRAHVGISKHIVNNIKKIIPISKHAVISKIYPSTKFPFDASNVFFSGLKYNKIILVSRIVEGKGHRDLITATKNLNVDVTIVGSGEKKTINKLIESIDKVNQFKYNFLGHLDNFKVYKKLSENGIFVFPSYGEGLGNSLVEALGLGLVCIAYDNTVFREFKDMGFHIHLVENRNTEKLKIKIQEVMDDYHRQWDMSQNNIKLASDIFSVDNEISGFLALLK